MTRTVAVLVVALLGALVAITGMVFALTGPHTYAAAMVGLGALTCCGLLLLNRPPTDW